MSRQRTIHLSAQSLKAIRPSDGLSPRINQIIERYQALMAPNPLNTLRLNPERRLQLRLTLPSADTPTQQIRGDWARALAGRDDDLSVFVGRLGELDLLRAVEALEVETMQ